MHIDTTLNQVNKEISFPVKLGEMNIIGMNIHLIGDEGVVPVIMYVTNEKLEKQYLEAELNKNKKDILDKFQGIEKDFNYIIMKAHSEIPSESGREYKAYNTVFKIK